MKNYETLKYEQSGEVVTVSLNSPPLNLFGSKMLEEMIDCWHSLRNNLSARFLILTAEGDNFSAGADINEFGTGEITPQAARQQQLNGHEMMRSLESLEQITVCAMRGVVCGAGMAVAQACDFRIMTENSHFLVPETNVGTYYTWGCTPRLVRLVGASKTMEIIMTCDPVPAGEAYRLNLANRVVPNDSLMEATHEFIAKIASRSPMCVRITKKLALGASMEGFGNMFICEPELIEGVVYAGDLKEGMRAFLEKRPPKYKP
ncbi:MAG: enoyl-CoA hydratase/isomerase family protein [Deltaproteobacteria bacterium]|nr:enoyl-CoA hydratase/isomerase family protein [Deltaproteobacteria bacterium]